MNGQALFDEASRRTLTEFAIQCCLGCCLALGVCLFGLRGWAGAGDMLRLFFSLSGLMTLFRIVRRGDRFGAPSLNLWDEVMAFNGFVFLLHAVIRPQ